jgi:hypothetical protein
MRAMKQPASAMRAASNRSLDRIAAAGLLVGAVFGVLLREQS